MTSQKSSVNPRFNTFRSALASHFVLPLLLSLALAVLIPLLNYLDIADNMARGVVNVQEEYTYFFMMGYQEIGMISILLTAVCSVLLGVAIFRFIASKKTVGVFYSLGITRKSLFVSKYLAGVLMLVVAVAVPMLINVVLNISHLGSSWQLWSAAAYYFWSFAILACFSFTVTAAVFSCVGTVAEGCFFSFVILGAPTIVLFCLQFLMEMLAGNPYGHYFTPTGAYQAYKLDLPTAYSAFNPLFFLKDGMRALAVLYTDGTYWAGTGPAPWSKPDFLPLVAWTVAVAAAMGLGMYLFQKRKAEICGFPGANPVMNFLVTFLLGLLGFGLAVYMTAGRLPLALAILLGLAAYAVIYCIADMALIRSWKEFRRGLVKLPVHLGVALVIGVVFATGLFGFSTRVPELSEIKSASITVPSDAFIGVSHTGGGGMADSKYEWASYGNMLGGITRPEDLAFVRRIHQQLVESGGRKASAGQEGIAREDQLVENPIQLVYELKNGKTLTRYYGSVPMAVVNQLLEIEDTEAGQQQARAFFTGMQADEEARKGGAIALISPYMERETVAELSASQRKTLLQCIVDDLTAQKAARRYFPTDPLLGLLNLTDAGGRESAGERSRFVPSSGSRGLSYTVYLTRDMRNTISFLQANGFYALLGQPAEVESAKVVRANGLYNWYYDRERGSIYNSSFLIGVWESQRFYKQSQKDAEAYGRDQLFENAATFAGAQQAQEIAARSHVSYFYGVDGYFVQIKLVGGKGYTTMFLPESAAPQYVRAAVK